ncbi:MAG TPA: class I SAM-dependent methyltransferase [Micropepsaceae bacterium]|nr:class I SAM-dependent methyltransferase [Micropepsaceae bacterium]
MTATNAGQVAYWNGPIGKVWAREQVKRDRDHEVITRAVLALAAPQSGEHVLDIGCGSGTTTLLLADAVGDSGSALGIDISEPMLGVARRRASESGRRALFVEADVTDQRFAPASFDLAFSQFGVMFFADPVAAFSNIHRSMKEHGRLVFACWRHPFENPWANVPESAAKPLLPPAPPAPADAPGRYSFANPDRVKSVLLQAGFHGPQLEKIDARVYLGATPEAAAASSIDTGPLMRTIADADEETRAKVRAAVTQRLAQEMGPGGIFLTAGAWLASAKA